MASEAIKRIGQPSQQNLRAEGGECVAFQRAFRPGKETYPRLSGHGYPGATSSPRGSHPEVCRWRGEVGACGWSYDPLPGGFGAPPWGYYGPCARSSLDGLAEAALSDTAVWRTLWGVEAAGRHGWPARPYKRGSESENRR